MTRFKTVLKNSSYLFGSRLVTRVFYTGFVIYAARSLGPELFGILAFSLAMVELLSWIGDMGLTQYGARELIARPEQRSLLNAQLLVLQIFSSIVLCLGGLVLILAWHPPEPKMEMLLMGLVAVLLSGVVNTAESVLIASQNFLYSAMLNFTGRIIFLAIGFIAIFLGASVVVVMAGFLLGILTESVLRFLLVLLKLDGFSFRFGSREVKLMLLASMPFAVVAVMSVIYSQAGMIILEIMKGDAAVGVYGFAYSLFIPFVWLSTNLGKAIFPGLAELYRDNATAARHYFRQWYRLMIIIAIPLSVATTLLADPVFSRFMGGYEESATVLIMLMWSFPILLIAPMELSIIQIIGQEKKASRTLFVAVLCSLSLQLLLIPRFGVVGAAVGVLAGALVREVQYYEVLRRKFFAKKHLLPLYLRPAVAGIVMALVASLASALGPWLAAVTGAVAYVGVIFATGGVKISEIKALIRG